MKKLRVFFVSVIIAVMSFTLTGCGKKENVEQNEVKEPAFAEEQNLVYSNIKEEFEAPLYAFAEDEDKNPITIEGLEFIPHNLKYNFKNWNISEPDENGNVILSYDCDTTGEVEFKISEKNTRKWFYSYSYQSIYPFDYYTGDIYRANKVSLSSSNNIMENGIEEKNNEEMKYTDVVWNGKTTKIGVLEKYTFNGWGEKENLGKEGEFYHCKNTFSLTISATISMPKDYDGVLIALYKKGGTKEGFERDYENQQEFIKLQKEANESGEKSERLSELEKEKDTVHKLINTNDESRKDRKVEDYFVFKVTDAFKTENNEG